MSCVQGLSLPFVLTNEKVQGVGSSPEQWLGKLHMDSSVFTWVDLLLAMVSGFCLSLAMSLALSLCVSFALFVSLYVSVSVCVCVRVSLSPQLLTHRRSGLQGVFTWV